MCSSVQTILSQSFLNPLLTCLTVFALQLFIFQLSHSPCFKPSIFLIGYIILTQSSQPVSTLDWQSETVIIVFISVEIISRYMTINFCSLFM